MVGIRASDKITTPKHENHDATTTTTTTTTGATACGKKMMLESNKQRQSSAAATCDFLKEEEEQLDEEFEQQEEADDDDEHISDAEPIGKVIRVSHESGEKRNHFTSFRYDAHVFLLEDTVLIAPEEGKVKPSVALIKDIFQTDTGNLMVRGQRFYRPEEAAKKEGGTWESGDARELFYSSHVDELEACTVMHKCVIHFVPVGKTKPDRKLEPGFTVQKVYDFVRQKLRYLTEKDCEGVLPSPGAA